MLLFSPMLKLPCRDSLLHLLPQDETKQNPKAQARLLLQLSV